MSVVPIDLTAAIMELNERQLNADLATDPDPDGLFLIRVTEEVDDEDVPDMDDLDNQEDGVVGEGSLVEGSYVAVYGDYNVAVTPDLITRLRLLSLMSQEAINSMVSAMTLSPDDEEEFVVVEHPQRSQL
jgi:hypothetical protein